MTDMFLLQQICSNIKVIKIKSDIINEDNRTISYFMVSIVEILCVIKGKIGLVY